jgi:hypothetical protein
MTIKNEGVRNLNENTLVRTGKAGTNVEGFKPMTINGQTIDTDWYDYVYRTGFSYNNAMSFSGGTDKTSYYFSLGNTKQKGMLVNNDFSRTNARVNVDHKVFKTLQLVLLLDTQITLTLLQTQGRLVMVSLLQDLDVCQ